MTGFDPARRSGEAEWMDEPGVPFEDLRACLADLAAVNRLTLGHRPTLTFLERLRPSGRLPTGRPVRILDVGCGDGDMLRRVASWARRRRVAVDLAGLDINPSAIRAAREATPADLHIRFETADALAPRPGPSPDVVLCALFAHHLRNAELVRYLAWCERTAAVAWFVNDLERSRLAWLAFKGLSRSLGWHRFVQHDGPVSIARAFRRSDWIDLLRDAGVPSGAARLERFVPYRLCVGRIRP